MPEESMKLPSTDLVLPDVKERKLVLKAALAPIRADYDYIILDFPPSLGLLTFNALTASEFFVIPLTPDYLALEGLLNLMEAVQNMRGDFVKSTASECQDEQAMAGALLTKRASDLQL